MKKTIKIGINASFLRKPNTGIGQVTFNFLKKLNELGEEHLKGMEFILYLEEDLSKDMLLSKKFKNKVFLPFWKRDDLIRKIWWEKFSLPRQIKKDHCDIFFSLYQCPTILNKSIRHIMLVHDIIPKLFPNYLNNSRKRKYWSFVEKGILSANRIITVSKHTEKDLIKNLGLDPQKITVSHIDVDEIYKEKISQKDNQKILKKYHLQPGYIFAGGGYEVRKNVEGVIRAYKFLEDKYKQGKQIPSLVIYGRLLPNLVPLVTDAEKLIAELNLTKKVKLLGEVPQKEMPALFENSIFFVYPSFYEGFGLPVLEAMNLKKPVIAAKLSSLPEVGGDSALYCDPSNIQDIAMVMKNLLFRGDLREQISLRSFSRAKQFSWKNFCQKFLNIAKNEISQ